ncbi:hypothetical protein GGE50_004033 [Rhizobium leguminosarum]|nr:hypothetical protein [Rhizobium leguminosarum]MBB4341119.1 hypothetical protein [Rhizobium leguminosarum]MBB4352990.1 hypothetical protein [Rhizobium leguminosarum]MBB4389039.1 hypothetical protein [Rhizobium leguminosarum]MBB4467280.1 hypothetical protein [Rhizobium leguminosarum]
MIKDILPAFVLGLTTLASTALPAAPVHSED